MQEEDPPEKTLVDGGTMPSTAFEYVNVANRLRASSAPRWQGPALSLRAHGAAIARDRHLPRGRVRARRSIAAALRSFLVPGVRVRARFRLALERPHHDRVRCA